MNTLDLKNKWLNLKTIVGIEGYLAIRITSECVPEFFLGLDKLENRCMILSLPKEHKPFSKSIEKKNLSLNYYSPKNLIVLYLKDDLYFDLFDDLIVSFYDKIKDKTKVNDCISELADTFYRWSSFFEDNKNDRLSQDTIKGLFGELLFLKSQLLETNKSSADYILSSWKGPYDQAHDFVLDEKNVEIKTKDLSRVDISISSEYQLKAEIGKKLELIVISVLPDVISGKSINFLVSQIKRLVFEKNGDCSILFRALMQKGINLKNIQEYDNIRFKPINLIIYNCDDDRFPKLTNSNTHDAISSIKYNLTLNYLKDFIISEKDLSNGN